MKIFYAIQATGNGHIARAIELMPFLQQYGTVDVFLSGSNGNLNFDLPVQYRSKGLSLFYHNNGGLDYLKMLRQVNLHRIYKEAKALPLEKYDIVINDFESITALACKLKKIKSVNFGHQASFQSNKTPRPLNKDIAGELILKKYAVATTYVGLHFEQYDDFIFNPVIKQDILHATPKNANYITVYLSHYADEVVAKHLKKIKDFRFEVFSKTATQKFTEANVTFIPIHNKAFNESMINCTGIITGAGFETPAEALYLGKKLLCIPIKGQYEQLCNAAALQRFDVPIVETIDTNFASVVTTWLQQKQSKKLTLTHSIAEIVEIVIEKALELKEGRYTILGWN